jgi:hypothetical protein
MCFTNYIGLDRTTLSRSGLYAVDLPGIVLSTFEDLTTEDQADYQEFWEVVYARAISNLVSDVSNALQSKFHVDSKLLTRETSEFTDANNSGSNYAGILIEFNLPKYARIHIISAEIIINNTVAAGNQLTLKVFDEQGGAELYSESFDLAQGKQALNIDQDFESDTLFVAYVPQDLADLTPTNSSKQTENKKFYSNLVNNKLSCETCFGDGFYTGTISHVNGGGLNIRYVIYCSIEKFVCENINLFKKALWWKVGEELAVEMIFGERINRFTTMSSEGADKRMAFFTAQFQKELGEAVKSQNIPEDLVCFRCKNVVESINSLP